MEEKSFYYCERDLELISWVRAFEILLLFERELELLLQWGEEDYYYKFQLWMMLWKYCWLNFWAWAMDLIWTCFFSLGISYSCRSSIMSKSQQFCSIAIFRMNYFLSFLYWFMSWKLESWFLGLCWVENGLESKQSWRDFPTVLGLNKAQRSIRKVIFLRISNRPSFSCWSESLLFGFTLLSDSLLLLFFSFYLYSSCVKLCTFSSVYCCYCCCCYWIKLF